MGRPDEIPQDIWDTAGAKAAQYVEWLGSDEPEQAEHVLAVTISHLVLAERERLTSPAFLERQIEAVGLVGKEAIDEAIASERERVATARREIAELVPDDAEPADDTDNQAGFRNAIEQALWLIDAALNTNAKSPTPSLSGRAR